MLKQKKSEYRAVFGYSQELGKLKALMRRSHESRPYFIRHGSRDSAIVLIKKLTEEKHYYNAIQ